ncbi:hypothetical protein Rsub_08878 [Raphidocelis subcapitata]|uniref:U-box domain-containing protein n=1 Tax=Raphidocelis subcapitata TaxID=307507 RepID=A0A2V0PE04_9CHLO|nr:hypothetical protein Rsub_08878 [Raphidocelis subcapitata]|eukprot:GBF96130.1 hypothetical protein Rsub_08878 [Raphidocelis subcapitata]
MQRVPEKGAGLSLGSGSFHAAGSAAVAAGAAANAALFNTPAELCCPITQELMNDPVLATSGQIYERAAIETHFSRASAAGALLTDPLTNAPLASDQLLPVFPMRSRAAEYREATVRACIAAAVAGSSRAEAVRHLRRAAELVLPPLAPPRAAADAGRGAGGGKRAGGGSRGRSGGGGSPEGGADELMVAAPGLSPDLARFLVSHRGDAYAAVALKWFGNELLRGGFPDQAADVFYGLLLEECDRQQQADYLQLCLACWGHRAGGAADGKAAPAAGQAPPPAAVGADAAIIEKLADFVERQQTLSAGDVIDMLQAPDGIGRAGALRLCDALLARAAAAGGGGGGAGAGGGDARRSSGGGAGGGAGGAQSELARSVELLTRYVRLSCAETSDGLRHTLQPAGGAAAAVAAAAPAPSGGGAGGKPGRGRRLREAAARARDALSSGRARAAASCVLAAASLAGGSGLLLRATRLVPLLVLLHATVQHQQPVKGGSH